MLARAVMLAFKKCPCCDDRRGYPLMQASEIKTATQVDEILTYRLASHLKSAKNHLMSPEEAQQTAVKAPVRYCTTKGEPWTEISFEAAWVELKPQAALPPPPPPPVLRTGVLKGAKKEKSPSPSPKRQKTQSSSSDSDSDERTKTAHDHNAKQAQREPTPEKDLVEYCCKDISRITKLSNLAVVLDKVSRQMTKLASD